MATIQLTRNKAFSWHNKNGVYAKGYLFAPDEKLYKEADLCSYFDNIKNENDFREKLRSANGIFSVVIQRDHSVWMAVDRFRYFPLFYRKNNCDFRICDEVNNLYEHLEQKELDSDSCLTFSGLGYVLGKKTLLKDIFQVQAGECVIYNQEQIASSFYHCHFSETKDIDFDEAKVQLRKIFQNIGRRMLQLIGDRPVILSLSGGFDSRLIAYILKKEGVKNVLCYTYGVKKENPEWMRSKKVAEKLGFEWLFIDYSTIEDTQFHKQGQFVDFYTSVAQYVSKFGFMPYFAANYFINQLKIPSDAILMTGDGGDFLSGSHLRSYMKKYKSISAVSKDLQYTHCRLTQLNRGERKKITGIIRQELQDSIPLFCNIENWDLKERQAKYIVNASKLWECFNLKSQIPLCDIELMDFFVSLPFEYRLNQNLYKTVLTELFEEFDINFTQDAQPKETAFIQQLKVHIKRLFPFLRRKQDIFMYDYFDFRRFSQPILKELQDANQVKKITSLNGIFSEWYLLQVKKEI
jgi:asparagine synthase (glutamine-hydrolysing)